MKEKILFNWSSGKDSAFALHQIIQSQNYEIISLLTCVNKAFQRVSMHGVRVELLKQQANRMNLPLLIMEIPEQATMQEYEIEVSRILSPFKNNAVETSVFGDLFLEDLKLYREQQLAKIGMKAFFPLWKRETTQLAQDIIHSGFRSIITCVNEKYLDASFVGREFDFDFITDLPNNVDPCGENGEFHSFVYDCPLFSSPIPIEKGDVVYKKYPNPNPDSIEENPYDFGFWFCDLLAKKDHL